MLMFRLPYRNFGSYEAMVANHTVNVNGRAGIKWYELEKIMGRTGQYISKGYMLQTTGYIAGWVV